MRRCCAQLRWRMGVPSGIRTHPNSTSSQPFGGAGLAHNSLTFVPKYGTLLCPVVVSQRRAAGSLTLYRTRVWRSGRTASASRPFDPHTLSQLAVPRYLEHDLSRLFSSPIPFTLFRKFNIWSRGSGARAKMTIVRPPAGGTHLTRAP